MLVKKISISCEDIGERYDMSDVGDSLNLPIEKGGVLVSVHPEMAILSNLCVMLRF